jgi:Zinc carboxypeptidase
MHNFQTRFCLLLAFFNGLCSLMWAQHIPFSANTTKTWQECIAAYEKLDIIHNQAALLEVGTTDIGKPLHLFVINKDGLFYPELFDRKKSVLLINNAIHPGEPDGVDACIMLCTELLDSNSPLSKLLDSTIVCVVPMYNVDGALNRGSHSRANQNGPAEYGFRGNARNLDLNRDFVKCDSQNAQSFNQIFGRIKPNVLVDTHVSNGADYPYTITLITTQSNKLGGEMGSFLKEKMEPALYQSMLEKGEEMCPYVHTMGRTPDTGLHEFLETPRFATGYAALFNCIGFTTETHMLKPYANRVEATYKFLSSLLQYMDANATQLVKIKNNADQDWMQRKTMFLNFELDTTQKQTILFNGYAACTKPADVGTGERLFYDKAQPWQRSIPFYSTYKGADEITIPKYYIVPQAWTEAIERLKWNGVRMTQITRDTLMQVTAYYIEDYKTGERPYEGHYNHTQIKIKSEKRNIQMYKGDYLIDTKQPTVRYIITVLEPQCEDSFFAWNFFDSVLQQKEWFSDYVFEDIAADLLANDKALKKQFDDALATDATLKNNHWNQLYWVYKHSAFYEPSAYRYPVYRLD